MIRVRATLLLAAAVAFVGLWASEALGRATHDSPYSYEQTFGSALRMIKVDLDLEVTEKDSEWGYFLFEYTSSESGSRKAKGSFQFVQQKDAVQVAVQLPSLPSYHEQMLVEKLRRKLVQEHGAPPRKKKPKQPKQDDEPKKDGDKPKQ